MEHAITKAEMVQVMDEYFRPIFQILGGIAAIFIIGLAVYFIIVPFLRKI